MSTEDLIVPTHVTREAYLDALQKRDAAANAAHVGQAERAHWQERAEKAEAKIADALSTGDDDLIRRALRFWAERMDDAIRARMRHGEKDTDELARDERLRDRAVTLAAEYGEDVTEEDA